MPFSLKILSMQMEHDRRYERAAEWLEIIKLLWTRDEEFDYEGQFYRIKAGPPLP